MEFELETRGRTITASLTPQEQGRASAVINGNTVDIHYRRISEHQILLTVNGVQHTAFIHRQPGSKTVVLEGLKYDILDRLDQDRAKARKKQGQEDTSVVTPPMPAVVIKVAVAQGDTVEKGQTLVVVSAMKMETSLKAPYSGTVSRVSVHQGDKVMPGDVLVDIKPGVAEDKEVL